MFFEPGATKDAAFAADAFESKTYVALDALGG